MKKVNPGTADVASARRLLAAAGDLVTERAPVRARQPYDRPQASTQRDAIGGVSPERSAGTVGPGRRGRRGPLTCRWLRSVHRHSGESWRPGAHDVRLGPAGPPARSEVRRDLGCRGSLRQTGPVRGGNGLRGDRHCLVSPDEWHAAVTTTRANLAHWRRDVEVRLSAETVRVVEQRYASALADPAGTLRRCRGSAVAGPSPRDLVRPVQKVAICDVTRPQPRRRMRQIPRRPGQCAARHRIAWGGRRRRTATNARRTAVRTAGRGRPRRHRPQWAGLARMAVLPEGLTTIPHLLYPHRISSSTGG